MPWNWQPSHGNRACVLSLPVLYAVGIAEKGSPCARRLGVATDTTGVVRVWATWAPAAKRWAFCQKSTHELPAAQTRREETHAYHHARMTSFIDVCSDMLGMTMCMRLDRSWVKVNRGDLPSWGSWWRASGELPCFSVPQRNVLH